MITHKIWDSLSIGQVAKVLPGYAFRSQDFCNKGIPVVKIKNILGDCTVCMNDADCISEELLSNKHKTYILHDGAMLIAMTGATAGKVGKLRSKAPVLLNQRVAQFKPFGIDPCFFWAVISSHAYQGIFFKLADGAAQPNMSGKQIENVIVPFPPLPIQRRIASILSAYDDLIENNTRRIAILEEMTRRLYEEWFVNFRFPGHETARFVETELGAVPEGWDVVRLDALVYFNPRTSVPKTGRNIFIPMSALSENNMQIGAIEYKSGNSGAKFQNGDTLFARITPCLENGKTGFVNFLPMEQQTACGSTEFIVLRSIALCPEIVYCIARSSRFRDIAIKSMSGATGRQRVRTESLEELLFAKPDYATIDCFQNIVHPMFDAILALQNKNANLRAQRDLLLPKLISGELDVSEAEDVLEEIAV